jgi:hypothetical protein
MKPQGLEIIFDNRSLNKHIKQPITNVAREAYRGILIDARQTDGIRKVVIKGHGQSKKYSERGIDVVVIKNKEHFLIPSKKAEQTIDLSKIILMSYDKRVQSIKNLYEICKKKLGLGLINKL